MPGRNPVILGLRAGDPITAGTPAHPPTPRAKHLPHLPLANSRSLFKASPWLAVPWYVFVHLSPHYGITAQPQAGQQVSQPPGSGVVTGLNACRWVGAEGTRFPARPPAGSTRTPFLLPAAPGWPERGCWGLPGWHRSPWDFTKTINLFC